MASTEVDICNLSLGMLGDKRIQSMDERSVEAVECKRFYDQVLDEVLEAYDWPFARGFARGVAPSNVDLLPGYAYGYVWPAKALAIRGIARGLRDEPSVDFVMLSYTDLESGADVRVIHTNRDGGILSFTRRVTAVPLYTPLFCAALAARLAFYLSMPLKKSTSERDRAEKLYDKAIEIAAVSVANQGKPSLGQDVDPDWIQARGGLNRRGMA